MSVEGCGLDNDEERYTNAVEFFVATSWNHHLIAPKNDGLAYLVKGYQKEGWGQIKSRMLPMKSSVGGSVVAKKDSEGDSSIKGEVHVNVKDDDGNKISVAAEGSIKNDNNGNVKTDGGIKVSFEKEF